MNKPAHPPHPSRSLRYLLAGLALGSALAATAHHFTRPAAPPASASQPHATAATVGTQPASSFTAARVAPSLVLPPPLAGAEADAALADYLALPPLPKDAPATEIETRLARLRALLTLLPDTHYAPLFAALATRDGDPEARLRRSAFDSWTERDAPAAARWAATLVPGEAINAGARSRFAATAALAWSRDDFTAAYAWTSTLTDPALRRDTSSKLLGQLAAQDVPQALALAQTGDEKFTQAARRAIFSTWAKRDPAAALQSLGAELHAKGDQYWPVRETLITWIGRDPKSAIDWALAQPIPEGESHRALLNSIGWSLAEKPSALRPVIDLLASSDDFPGRSGVLHDIIGPWIRQDGAAAMAWLDTMADVAFRNDLIDQALGHVEQGKADDFIKLAQKLPDSAERDRRIANRFSTWAEEDPDAALAWLSQHDAPALANARRHVEGKLIGNLAQTDPRAALARWQALPADATRHDVTFQLAKGWAKNDSAAATRWLAQQIPPNPENGFPDWPFFSQLQAVASRWAHRDPLAYLAWTETLPDPRQRSLAADALTNHNGDYNERPDPPPRAARASQLAQIKDPALRERVLTRHLSDWLRSDVRAARAWIESNDALSPETAARLLTQTETSY